MMWMSSRDCASNSWILGISYTDDDIDEILSAWGLPPKLGTRYLFDVAANIRGSIRAISTILWSRTDYLRNQSTLR